jgi:hypothetical protein
LTDKINTLRPYLDGLLPDSPLWHPTPGGDFDNFLEALSVIYTDRAERLRALSTIRLAAETSWLEELEKDYGLLTSAQQRLSEERRREILRAFQNAPGKAGKPEFLETLLRNAGFEVDVFQNSPPQDPSSLLGSSVGTACDYTTAYMDYIDALMGSFTPEILVNGDYIHFVYSSLARWDGDVYMDGENAFLDYYEEKEILDSDLVSIYDIPVERWKYVFAIGIQGEGFNDWILDPEMEYPTASVWTLGEYTGADKVADVFSHGGDRSLLVSGDRYLDSQDIAASVDDDLIASWEFQGKMHKDDTDDALKVYCLLPPLVTDGIVLTEGDLDFSEETVGSWTAVAEFTEGGPY